MSFFEKLGIKRVINCNGTYTLVGGHTFSDYVREAMDEADRNFAWLWEIEEKAGKRICELTGAEAAFVTPGVFAALSMGAARAHLKTDYEAIFKAARAKAVMMAEAWEKIPGVKTRLLDIGEVFDDPGRISARARV